MWKLWKHGQAHGKKSLNDYFLNILAYKFATFLNHTQTRARADGGDTIL